MKTLSPLFTPPQLLTLTGAPVTVADDGEIEENGGGCGKGSGETNSCYDGSGKNNDCGSGSD